MCPWRWADCLCKLHLEKNSIIYFKLLKYNAMTLLNKINLLFIIILAGCASTSTMKAYQGAIEKYSEYRYCALAVEPVAGGRTDEAVQTNRMGSNTICANTQEYAKSSAINECSNRLGKTCVLAYEYDRNNNSYRSNQTKNIKVYEDFIAASKMKIAESKMKKCDGYGFKRGTTPFAQCMQQIEQQQAMQDSMDLSIQIQQNEIFRQTQQDHFRKAQCYATGRMNC